MDDELVTEIAAGLAEDGVWVGPDAEGWVTPVEEAALEADVAASEDPVFVVLAAPPADADPGWGDDLAFRLHDATGADGLYLGIDHVYTDHHVAFTDGRLVQPYAGDDSFRVSVQQWGEVAGSTDVGYDVGGILEYGDDGSAHELGTGLLEVTGALADGTFPQVAAQAAEDRSASLEEVRDDGSWGTLLVVGAVLLALVLAAVVLLRRARRRGPAARRGLDSAPFTLPASVLARVREAGDADAVRRARAAVLALGERIDATDIDAAAGAQGDASWQAALDHYDAATRLLPTAADEGPDDPVDVLDAVGALVMAERGEVALDAALRGAAFTPPRPCFLNPLHGAAADPRPLEVGDHRVDAPVCRACRRDLEAGRRPDVLDVEHRGRPAHYFETDREPWASTGFGALDPDLLTRLHRDRR